MDLINQFFDAKKKELEDAFDEWHAGKDLWKLPGGVSPREEEAFVNFTQELGKTAGDVLDLPAVEVVKLLFIYSSFYFLIMQEIIRLKTKEKHIPCCAGTRDIHRQWHRQNLQGITLQIRQRKQCILLA